MQAKLLELRDKATFIPLLCIDMNSRNSLQRPLLRRCGYPLNGQPNIAIVNLNANGDKFCNDPYYWFDRSYQVAHHYIIEHWVELDDGDVVDVEFILGETTTKKVSEVQEPQP